MKTANTFDYKLKQTRHSSARLGNCEVCRAYCETVYMQIQRVNKDGRYVSNNDTHMMFGHKDCLVSKQVAGAA